MKFGRFSFCGIVLLLALGFVGCSSGPNDQQIAQQVQGKIYADATVTSRQVTADAKNGVVTLTGSVATDAERQAAAGDAAQVAGVKTVVNNLSVAPAAPSPSTEQSSAAQPAPAPESSGVSRRARRNHRGARTAENSPSGSSSSAAASAPETPATPAAPATVVIPAGTEVAIRMIDSINSRTSKAGDVFRASLDAPIVVDGRVVVPKGADVQGQVVAAKSTGKFTGNSALALTLSKITVGGDSYDLATDQYSQQGSSRGKRTAETVGGGAAIGAIIGAIAGHGKGAAIGGAAGAGTGAAVQALTHGQQVNIPSETRVVFHLSSPVSVIPAS